MVALGCTHYPFVRDDIARVLGDSVAILDTADAVASRAARLWRAPATEVDAAWCRLERPATAATDRRFARAGSAWPPLIAPAALML